MVALSLFKLEINVMQCMLLCVYTHTHEGDVSFVVGVYCVAYWLVNTVYAIERPCFPWKMFSLLSLCGAVYDILLL